MHGNSSVRFQKAFRVLCRILSQKVDADGWKIADFSIAQTDNNVRRAHLRRRPPCERRRPRRTGSTSEIKMADRMECKLTKAS